MIAAPEQVVVSPTAQPANAAGTRNLLQAAAPQMSTYVIQVRTGKGRLATHAKARAVPLSRSST